MGSDNFQCPDHVSEGRAIPLKSFQRLLGLMVAAASVCRLGLLYMRPMQLYQKDHIPRKAWKAGRMHMLSPWFDRTMYDKGISMGRVVK